MNSVKLNEIIYSNNRKLLAPFNRVDVYVDNIEKFMSKYPFAQKVRQFKIIRFQIGYSSYKLLAKEIK